MSERSTTVEPAATRPSVVERARRQQLRRRLRSFDPITRDVALICVGFALLRYAATLGRPVMRYPDTPSYTQLDFFGHFVRLWTVPLLYRALPEDHLRAVAQITIGVISWSALAFALAKSIRHPIVARLAAVAIVVLGLCIQVTQWDIILLSESLTISLSALLVAGVLMLRRRPTTGLVVATLVVALLWEFTRQINATLFVAVAIGVIVWILAAARNWWPAAIGVAVIAAWGVLAVSNQTAIAEQNAHDVLVLQVLQEQGAPEFFRDAGMPRVDALAREARAWTQKGEFLSWSSPARNDPAWIKWTDDHWNETYARWLVRHPIRHLKVPALQVPELLSGSPTDATPRDVLPSPVQNGLWETGLVGRGDLPFLIIAVLVSWLSSLRYPRPPRQLSAAIAGAGIAFCVLAYYATWHFGAGDKTRHELPVAATTRVVLLILLFTSLDRIFSARSEAKRSAEPDDGQRINGALGAR